jgi:hypothetical protein
MKIEQNSALYDATVRKLRTERKLKEMKENLKSLRDIADIKPQINHHSGIMSGQIIDAYA